MTEKVYCLWGSCKKFNPQEPDLCPNPAYIATGKPATLMTLEEAKKQYPSAKFCEDWEPEKED